MTGQKRPLEEVLRTLLRYWCRLRSLQILAQVPVRLKVGLEVIPRS